MDIKEKLKRLPNSPGVYFFKDEKSRILYVGKAANLKKRLKSYFYKKEKLESKIRIMLGKFSDIDFKECASETEALILESELIKKLRPKYNSLGADDKSFPWIKITKEKFPVVSITRPKAKEEAILIGPFTSAKLLRQALEASRRIFPFRSCRVLPKKACLNFSLGLCPAPCINKIMSQTYQSNVKRLQEIFQAKYKKITKGLLRKMHKLSQEQKFEQAAMLRDQISALENLWQDRPSLGATNVLWQLKSALGLKRLPLRIEGFDISNIFGNQNVGSLVSFYKTLPDKSQYRRYRIKAVSGANDYASILEILRRRFTKVKEGNYEVPDLIVVDGGRPQVSAVKKALSELALDIPLLGIAKKKEHIFLPDNPAPLILPGSSKA
ncbi:MAG: GIY-YIG nuclease family protein, partial [Candidatus Omnitrophota bacterium]